MLKSISLKFTETSEPLVIPATGVTIFVGPNNSGKSLVLRELEQDFSTRAKTPTKILNDFDVNWPSETELASDIYKLERKAPKGTSLEHVYVGRFKPDGELDAHQINRDALMGFVRQRTEMRWFASQFLKYFLIRLDGRTRFSLTNDRPFGDLLATPQNILTHLFQNDSLRKEIREVVHDAFGVYFVIDALSMNILRIRLSELPPDGDEQNLNDAARKFHGAATYIKEASDGVQAFIGILCAVLSGDYRAVLIDEPEAFLHPPLARKLGFQLTSRLRADGSLMASTHSPDFLIGCLQASTDVKVVKLEYSNGKSKGKIIDSNILNQFFKSPLVRSANVISALFHDGVVVTESDNDRSFYAEIYYRLAEREKGFPSLLFINAQNKQTIKDIIGPLRTFGIPAVAVTDIDILKDGGSTWGGWLEAAHFPHGLHAAYGQIRGNLKKIFEDQNLDMKSGGVQSLSSNDRAAAVELFDKLEEYGVFVVRNGELESWLLNLGVKSKKTDWTIEMLEKLGSDPNSSEYVQPASSDVWKFVRAIAAWVKDPSRKGL